MDDIDKIVLRQVIIITSICITLWGAVYGSLVLHTSGHLVASMVLVILVIPFIMMLLCTGGRVIEWMCSLLEKVGI